MNVSNYCDIPTCRRAINELNEDPKIRNKLPLNMSLKIQQQLKTKNNNRKDLIPALTIKSGYFEVFFD